MKSFLLIFSLFSLCYSFWDVEHMVIANIAKADLISKDKKIVDFFETITKIMEPMSHGDIKDFVESAVWADKTMKYENKMMFNWHFINTPLNKSIISMPKLTNNDIKGTAIDILNNALYNLNTWTAEEKQNLNLQYEKSFYLRYLIHVIGDIHQPLHSCTWFDKVFPQGDKGGNDLKVNNKNLNNNQIKNLHSLWDSVFLQINSGYKFPLSYESKESNYLDSVNIMKKYPKSDLTSFLNKKNHMEWVEESWKLCKDHVYNDLHYLNNTYVDISESYIKNNQDIAVRQLAIAGYRLSNTLYDIWVSYNGPDYIKNNRLLK